MSLPPTTSSTRWPRWVVVFRAVVLLTTLGYIGVILAQALPATLAQVIPFTWGKAAWLLGATAMISSCTVGSALSFYLLARARATVPLQLGPTLYLHLTANLMRHLPGRFVGVAYQAALPLPGLTSADMVRINVVQVMAGLAGNAFMGTGIVLFCSGSALAGVLIAAATLPIMLTILTLRVPAPLRRWLLVHGPAKARALLGDVDSTAPPLELCAAALVQVAAWVPYLLGWHWLGHVFSPLEREPMVLLAASYSVAWVVGILTFITPGGLGVREAVFLLIAGGQVAREPLAFVTVFARLWSLVADVLAWLLAAAFTRSVAADDGRLPRESSNV